MIMMGAIKQLLLSKSIMDIWLSYHLITSWPSYRKAVIKSQIRLILRKWKATWAAWFLNSLTWLTRLTSVGTPCKSLNAAAPPSSAPRWQSSTKSTTTMKNSTWTSSLRREQLKTMIFKMRSSMTNSSNSALAWAFHCHNNNRSRPWSDKRQHSDKPLKLVARLTKDLACKSSMKNYLVGNRRGVVLIVDSNNHNYSNKCTTTTQSLLLDTAPPRWRHRI